MYRFALTASRSVTFYLRCLLLVLTMTTGAFLMGQEQGFGPETIPEPQLLAPGENPHGPVLPPGHHIERPMVVNLATARAYALHNHPSLRAYHASLRAAETKLHSLANIHWASVVRRDLPVRRRQAQKGIFIAQAELRLAQWDVLYGVTRMYFTAVYAMEQLRVADRALDPKADKGIRKLHDLLLDPDDKDKLREDLRRDLKEWDKDDLEVVIKAAEAKRVEAARGKERALAGLRDAMGLEAEVPLMIDPNDRLPELMLALSREHVVDLARSHRAEIAQSQLAYEVVCLEVTAQGKIFGLTGQTFAAGSDLHVKAVPLGQANGDYRPGAIAIEMPTTLVGNRDDRQAQVGALKERAAAVIDKTRHLIALQAEDTFIKWKQATEELQKYEKAALQAEKIGEILAGKFDPGYRPPSRNLPFARPDRPTLLELLNANIRAINLRLRTNQARFDLLVALTGVERATSGGVCPGFDMPLPIPAEPKSKDKADVNAENMDENHTITLPDVALPAR